MSFKVTSSSPEESEALGYRLGLVVGPGAVIALKGELGAGKTMFTKGLARGLGVPRPDYVVSPTFTIHRRYHGRLTLNHLDLYRLGELVELEDLGLEEVMDTGGVTVVEWPDRFTELLDAQRIDVNISVTGESDRVFEFTGELVEEIGKDLMKA